MGLINSSEKGPSKWREISKRKNSKRQFRNWGGKSPKGGAILGKLLPRQASLLFFFWGGRKKISHVDRKSGRTRAPRTRRLPGNIEKGGDCPKGGSIKKAKRKNNAKKKGRKKKKDSINIDRSSVEQQ